LAIYPAAIQAVVVVMADTPGVVVVVDIPATGTVGFLT